MTVFATYRNADMIEGKGPMVMDKVFIDETDAHAYINQQAGVHGRKPSDFGAVGGWQNTQMGDWQVRPLYILEHLEDSHEYVQQQLVKNAWAKLAPAERKALEGDILRRLT